MSTRLSRLAVAALILAVPVASFAGATDVALDACVQTFLTSDLAKDRKVTVRKNTEALPRPIALSGLYKVEVVATGRESGKRLARIVCHADSKGTIVAVNGQPSAAIASVASTR
jgi:hypothetical protein